MLPFHAAVSDDFAAVNQLIIDRLHSNVDEVENIGHYIVDSGGKRLRPVVVLLSALAAGYKGQGHIALAAIIEFIHTATLLHDDVVDTSTLRRGKPTANEKWGNAPSVLVGDFLYSRAFQMLVELGNMPIMNVMATATNVIAEGEVQQLINAGNCELTEDDYYSVIDKKTAKLFQAGAEAGALLAGAEVTAVEALSAYGHHLGMAFQIMDDVLDYAGETDAIGKNVGDDLAEGKLTLPLIYLLANGDDNTKCLIQEAIEAKNGENFDRVLRAVTSSDALAYTKAVAQQHVALACDALSVLPSSNYKTVMMDLANFAILRDH